MTLREEIIDLSEDRLDESVALGIIALAGLLGLSAYASISAIADKIKTKKWEKAENLEIIEKKAWRKPEQEIASAFDAQNNHLKTYLMPSESFLMKFAETKIMGVPVLNKVIIFDDFGFDDFLKAMKKTLTERYRELFRRLCLYDKDKSDKVKKYLEKKLSVEFYCRGIVAFTEKQKKEIEKTIREAIKEAGVDKFKFKMRSETYR